MSDEKKDLGDKAEDAFNDAKKGAENAKDKAEDAWDDVKDKTEKAYEEAKESAKEFSEDAKKTANEFTNSAKEAFSGASGENKKILVGILAIIFGALGVHKFILGYQKEGFILLGVTIASYLLMCALGLGLLFIWIPYVIGLVEGIIYLTKSDEEFYNTYQVGRKPWF